MNAPERLPAAAPAVTQPPQRGAGQELAAALSPELLQALFELSTVGVHLIDLTRQMAVAANPALLRITGYSEEELRRGNPADRFTEEGMVQRAGWFREASLRGSFGPAEVRYRHKNGHFVNLVFSGVRVTDPRAHQYLWLNVQDISADRAMQQALRAAASTDRLTGLANRATLIQALQEAVAEADDAIGLGPAVLFLDFDRFKQVNDTLGHEAGDALLRSIAARLRAFTTAQPEGSEGWLPARLGGDEFVLLLRRSPGLDRLQPRLAALMSVLAEPHALPQPVRSAASIGVAQWQDASHTADSLLREADLAMYEAKRQGRGRWLAFDSVMQARLHRQRRLQQAWRHGPPEGELSVLYQPVVDLQDARMVWAEARLSWHHPTLGPIDAEELQQAVDDSSRQAELGDWLLAQVCRQWASWQAVAAAGHAVPAVLSVSLPRAQWLHGAAFRQALALNLSDSGMPAAALQLELPEADVLADPAAARDGLQPLAALGVRLVLDGFGAGVAAVACLRQLVFAGVKIGTAQVQALVQDAHSLALAHALVGLLDNLGLDSVAAGIATPAELATLQALGCRYGQGPACAPAMLPAALLQYLAEPTRPA